MICPFELGRSTLLNEPTPLHIGFPWISFYNAGRADMVRPAVLLDKDYGLNKVNEDYEGFRFVCKAL